MHRRHISSLSIIPFLALVSLSASAGAQPSEIAGVKAANGAFYSAISARDLAAMRKVWAHGAGIRHIGPSSKVIAVGWDAIDREFSGTFHNFSTMAVTEPQPFISVHGDFAYVSGIEKLHSKTAAGVVANTSLFGTSIFEKEGGRWLMIYHHASPIPQ